MDILRDIRNHLMITVADTIENHVDGREVLNEKIRPTIVDIMKSEKDADKMLKGPVTDFLRELYEGIWGEKTNVSLEQWQHQINADC